MPTNQPVSEPLTIPQLAERDPVAAEAFVDEFGEKVASRVNIVLHHDGQMYSFFDTRTRRHYECQFNDDIWYPMD